MPASQLQLDEADVGETGVDFAVVPASKCSVWQAQNADEQAHPGSHAEWHGKGRLVGGSTGLPVSVFNLGGAAPLNRFCNAASVCRRTHT